MDAHVKKSDALYEEAASGIQLTSTKVDLITKHIGKATF